MQEFNILSGEPTQVGPVQVTYGTRGAALERPSVMLTYLYSPRGGWLRARDTDLPIPARAVTRIAPGIASRFFPREDSLENVIFRAEEIVPELSQEQRSAIARHDVTLALVNYEQWHPDIAQYFADDRLGGVIILPKFKPDGTRVPGWPCNYHKGQALQLDGAAEWTEIRAAEEPHYHIVLSEIYIGIHGRAKLRHNNDHVELRTGHALWATPGDVHCVAEITPEPLGFYSHTATQYPLVRGDKIVVE